MPKYNFGHISNVEEWDIQESVAYKNDCVSTPEVYNGDISIGILVNYLSKNEDTLFSLLSAAAVSVK